MEPKKWRTKIKYVDIDTGEELTKLDLLNYIILKKVKNESYVINGYGTTEYTVECTRAYERDLFNTRETNK